MREPLLSPLSALRSALGRHGLAGWRAASVLRGTKYSSLHQEEDKLQRETEGGREIGRGGRGVNVEYPRAIRESSTAGKFEGKETEGTLSEAVLFTSTVDLLFWLMAAHECLCCESSLLTERNPV